jgi:hypothetical protein
MSEGATIEHWAIMGFNRRKMEDQRRELADKEAAARRATTARVLEDAERLIADWNERQARRVPLLFSPTIGAAIAARYWFLCVRCPACQTINAIDLRTLDRYPHAAVTSPIPWLSCRSCRPNAPFAELVRLSRTKRREHHSPTGWIQGVRAPGVAHGNLRLPSIAFHIWPINRAASSRKARK